MNPDLEVVQIGKSESFTAWEHGYPFRTVRWHFHPEYEIHYVVATSGRYFVGDFIGKFRPGNLVLTGPNLPHNWVSNVSAKEQVPLRSRVVQFTEAFISDAIEVFPELEACKGLLDLSTRGAVFSSETSKLAAPILAELVVAKGVRRIEVFMNLIGTLSRATGTKTLTSADYLPDPSGFMSTGINEALAYINANLTEPFSENDLAEIAGLSPGAFSRSFRRHTGLGLVRYVNRLRINLACQMLMRADEMKITDVCFSSGFNNISNFNRQFQKQKGMSPSRFRKLLAENIEAVEAA